METPRVEAIAVTRSADWRRQAAADREAAESLFESRRYEWCCLACQQSAEKLLKAALEDSPGARARIGAITRLRRALMRVLLGTSGVEGHDLPTLLQRLAPHAPASVVDACRALNRFYIATRYPDMHERGAPADIYGARDAEEAMALLQVVSTFLTTDR